MKEPIYVEVSKEELETQEFENRLKQAYNEKENSQEVFIVVDGKVLKDPNNGGPIKKIGSNLYYGEDSGVQFKMDNGKIDHLKGLLKKDLSGLLELRDPNNGTPLIELEEGIYETCFQDIFVATTQDKLEDTEFNKKLEKFYEQHEKVVRLMVDGKELVDPICGGEVEKVGKNLYRSNYSGNTYSMVDGSLMNMIEPISGSPVQLQDDGRYYSEALDKSFTLEKAKDGTSKFFPAYLPYDGMTNVNAKVIGDRLVGENGISFPIFETGAIDFPMEDGLKTQGEIDASIAKKHQISEKALKKMQEKLDKELAEMLQTGNEEREALPEEVAKESKKSEGTLKFENVLKVSQTASVKDVMKVTEDITKVEATRSDNLNQEQKVEDNDERD